jgi:predicted ester cyclase
MLTPEQMREGSHEFLRRVFDNKDLSYVEEVLTDDFVEHSPLSPDMGNGKAAALATFQAIIANTPDLKAEILDIVVSGSKLAIRSRFSGTDSGAGWGAMMGAPATGKAFSVEGIDVVSVNDEGKYTDHYGIFDVPAMMMQLGLMPAPG